MRDFRDAKAMAQTLRDALAARSVSVTHSESLELVAKILGLRDWNVLSARLQSQSRPPATALATALTAGASLPVVPMRDIVFFPNMISPIFIGREKSKVALARAVATDNRILALTQRSSGDDSPTADTLYSVGVSAMVIDVTPLPDGTSRSIVKVLERVRVAHLTEGEDMLSAETAPFEQTRGQEAEAFKLLAAVLETLQAYFNADFSLSQAPYARLPHIREPEVFADAVAPLLSISIDGRQDLLETSDVVTRLEKILAVVTADRKVA